MLAPLPPEIFYTSALQFKQHNLLNVSSVSFGFDAGATDDENVVCFSKMDARRKVVKLVFVYLFRSCCPHACDSHGYCPLDRDFNCLNFLFELLCFFRFQQELHIAGYTFVVAPLA